MRGYLRIDIANNCNIRCIMCQAYNGMTKSDMSFLDYTMFARQTAGQLKEWQVIQLGNTAEPTVHPKFADYLRHIRSESDAVIHIVTNGKLLGRYAKLINEVGNCLVQISMDSLRKKTHEYIREGSDYDRLMAFLPLLDVSRTRVLLSFTLMKSNLDEYPEMVRFCQEHGYTMSAFPMILREEYSVIPYNLLNESLWFNLSSLKSWLREYYGKDYDSVVTGAAPGTTNLGISEFSCNAHNTDFGIQASGNTLLCFKAETGSLYEHRLEELWNSAIANGFRQQVDRDRGPCFECDYRKRCLSPSMSQMENHFSESICRALSKDTREAIGYDRFISDEEARDLFIRDLGRTKFGIFKIEEAGSRFFARRVIVSGDEYGGESPAEVRLEAGSRHELQQLMVTATGSILTARLVEDYGAYNLVSYAGQFWAFPKSLGVLNPTLEGDRQKPGVLSAETLEDLRQRCEEAVGYDIPTLTSSRDGHNIVKYLGRYWAVPQAVGPVDFTSEEERSRPEIIACENEQELLQLLDRVSRAAAAGSVPAGSDEGRISNSITRRAKTGMKAIVRQLYTIATKSHPQ